MRKPELLAPAGNLEKLKMALLYGADAVFLAGKSFGLRAFGGNFTEDELKEGIEFTHSLQKKAYITVNIFPHNEDLPALPDYIKFLSECNVDAVIVADLGVYRIIREVAPNLPIHISTQANNTNWSSVLFWQELGVNRVVLARELSLSDINIIREKVNIELEAFVHGAMCISYSGRCLMSNYFTDRDANRGQCAQPCRWKFNLVEEKRPGEYYPVMEDERGTYIFNSKDLCLLPNIPELVDSGLDSFKVEGRMKSVHYAATVIKVYREAIDAYIADPVNYTVKAEWLDELQKISHRAYTSGFYFNKTTQNDQIYGSSSYDQTFDFVGLIKSYDPITRIAVIEQRNNIKVGQEIEIMQPGKPNFTQMITEMFDMDGNHINAAPHAQQIFKMAMKQDVVEFAMLRREVLINE